MKYFLTRAVMWLLVVVIAVWGLGQLIEHNPGYLLIAMENKTLEANVWFAVGVLLLGLLLLSWLARLVRWSFRSISGSYSFVRFGSHRRAQKQTSQGLSDFMEGNWKSARKQLVKSAGKSELQLVNYLAAARCAHELGDQEEAQKWLKAAEQAAPKDHLGVALAQARMQLVSKQFEQCIATLERARKHSPKHPVVLELLARGYEGVNDWSALKQLLPALKKHGHLSSDEWGALYERVHIEHIVAAGDRAHRLPQDKSVRELEKAWAELPSNLTSNESLIVSYVQQLIRVHADIEAEALLRKSLKKSWHSEMVRLYGMVAGENLMKQQEQAEAWLSDHPEDPTLYLTLGRLSLRHEKWHQARKYFESSLSLEKSPETFAELARLLAHLGEYQQSTRCYQQGVGIGTSAKLPDLPQPDTINLLGVEPKESETPVVEKEATGTLLPDNESASVSK